MKTAGKSFLGDYNKKGRERETDIGEWPVAVSSQYWLTLERSRDWRSPKCSTDRYILLTDQRTDTSSYGDA